MMKSLATAAVGAIMALTVGPALADGMARGKGGGGAMHQHHGCAQFGGFYAGLHGGTTTLDTAWTDRDNWADRFSVDIALGHVSREETGINVGGVLGYNRQRGCTIFGVEADINWTNADGSRTYTGNGNPAQLAINLNDEVRWFGTLRTKAGIVVDNLMLYATGGLAFANVKHTWEAIDAGAFAEGFSISGTRFGWTAGVGSEWAWNERVSIKSEVLYIRLEEDSKSFASAAAGFNVNFDSQDTMWVSRIGLNIKLGDHGPMMHDSLK
jgi:outer membrane immunogenic protein